MRRRQRNGAKSQALKANSRFEGLRADVAQLVEHSLGKGEVTSSILVISSRDAVDREQWTVEAWARQQIGLALARQN